MCLLSTPMLQSSCSSGYGFFYSCEERRVKRSSKRIIRAFDGVPQAPLIDSPKMLYQNFVFKLFLGICNIFLFPSSFTQCHRFSTLCICPSCILKLIPHIYLLVYYRHYSPLCKITNLAFFFFFGKWFIWNNQKSPTRLQPLSPVQGPHLGSL